MSKMEQEIFDNIKMMNEFNEKKDSEKLASILVRILKQVKKLQNESKNEKIIDIDEVSKIQL